MIKPELVQASHQDSLVAENEAATNGQSSGSFITEGANESTTPQAEDLDFRPPRREDTEMSVRMQFTSAVGSRVDQLRPQQINRTLSRDGGESSTVQRQARLPERRPTLPISTKNKA